MAAVGLCLTLRPLVNCGNTKGHTMTLFQAGRSNASQGAILVQENWPVRVELEQKLYRQLYELLSLEPLPSSRMHA
jgi:hypothetical protein